MEKQIFRQIDNMKISKLNTYVCDIVLYDQELTNKDSNDVLFKKQFNVQNLE